MKNQKIDKTEETVDKILELFKNMTFQEAFVILNTIYAKMEQKMRARKI